MKLNTDIQLVKTLRLPFDVFTVSKEMISGTTSYMLRGPLKVKSFRYSYLEKEKRETVELILGSGAVIPVLESMNFTSTLVFTDFASANEQINHMLSK